MFRHHDPDPRAINLAKAMATSIFGLLARMRVIQEPLGALRRIAHIGDDAGLVVAEIELGKSGRHLPCRRGLEAKLHTTLGIKIAACTRAITTGLKSITPDPATDNHSLTSRNLSAPVMPSPVSRRLGSDC